MGALVVFEIKIFDPLLILPASAALTGLANNGPLQGSATVVGDPTTVVAVVSVDVGTSVGLGKGVWVSVDVGVIAA